MTFSFFKPATLQQADHNRKVARCHKIIEEIQDRALKLQQVADDLPPDEADELSDQAEILLEAADEMKVKVKEFEHRQ